ncbi:hypothetical protein AU255_09285 [Methyloprofundus sedimenti]|uniref:Uncharacterized protein n=1 Tax=Methyloprofundus sedimenti TaxID=1420851 RepID=A0A1V8M920_9GAMM|nr:tetratricopeptide repeat protein [Methyloprofundus sedimenti]OQK18028.1 hypothetical protein AU255_09285 [Methyloprofundus sedimenti]
MKKKITLLVCIAWLLAGCSSFGSKQAPAPVYEKIDRSANKEKKSTINTIPDQTTQIKTVQDPVIIKQQDLDPAVNVNSQPKSSTVVIALLSEADSSYKQGNLNESVATIERALRIEPRNALLLYKLATLRLQQGQPDMAENLAKKSELLAEGNAQLKRQNWLLIAEARKQLGNMAGAEQARKKASQY